ncbi:HAD-IA family hydrolase [Salinispira pacifica]
MPDKTTRALFLDVGGVLLTNGWGRESRRAAAKQFGLDYDDIDERHHLTFDTYEEGKISLNQYLQRVVFNKSRSFTIDEFKEYMFGRSQAISENVEYFRSLRKKYGLKVVAVSNEGAELTDYRINSFGLDDLFDVFISSSFVHVRKPDEDIYRIAMQAGHVSAQEAVYIDDRALFVEVAASMGIDGIHHKSLEDTKAQLENFGLED